MAKPASRVLRTGGLWFNGIDGYVKVLSSPSLNLTKITELLWFKPSTKPGGGIYDRISGFDDYVFEIGYSSAMAEGQKTALRIYTPATGWRDVGTILTMAAWNHLALTYDGAIFRFYLNGAAVWSLTAANVLNTANKSLYIACTYHLREKGKGFIDKFRIYNRALSSYEISEIYTKDTFIKDGLVLYLPFYEGEGNIAHDVSGYGNHGTIYGASWVVKKALRVLPKAG